MTEAVRFVRKKIRQLLLSHDNLIANASDEVANLEICLARFERFDNMKRKDDHIFQELVRQINDVVYKVEDDIDTFVAQVTEEKRRRSTNYFLRVRACHPAANVLSVTKRIESFVDNISSFIHISNSNVEQRQWPKVTSQPLPSQREDKVVGFDEETQNIMGYLKEESEELDVITIVGMPGIGKTTLANKIFHDQEIGFGFPIRIWINVSDEFSEKDVFLAILNGLNILTEDMKHKDDQELAHLSATYLEKHKFLVVVDNVGSPDDWNIIRQALPSPSKYHKIKSKVLITSCNENVARHANRYRDPHKVPFLTQSQSWSLLQSEVFGKQECPRDLEDIGKLIAKQCDGLPLAILLMAGILVEQDWSSLNMRDRRTAWVEACERFPEYHNKRFYNSLPHHLQACFLYFGMFPCDFEIPVWKLIRMWIAEGFIIDRDDRFSLEETAEHYLEDLIARNLVRVGKFKSDGRIKTCRVHRMMYEFCKSEAGYDRENAFHEIKFSDGEFEPVSKYHRLCIHSNVRGFLSSKPFGPRVRSLACCSKEDTDLAVENCLTKPAAFGLLRVLEAMPIKFTEIHCRDIYRLVHLRYLAFSFNSSILLTEFSRLWNLQTLVVNTTSRTLEIRADIWEMTELRHFKTNASATLCKAGKFSIEDAKLQTLGTVSPECCTDKLFGRASKLKKLGIRGQLSLFLEGGTGSFESLGRLNFLESLKMLNDVFPLPPSEGKLRSLPDAHRFPPSLRTLTLASTFLDWNKISALEYLSQLEVLKLKDNACVGRNWETTRHGGFKKLETLHIGRTDLVIWVASAHHFPSLRRLKLHNCGELERVPTEVADIPSLQLLDLFHCKSAAASAKRILERKLKHRESTSPNAREFKLSIYPSSH